MKEAYATDGQYTTQYRPILGPNHENSAKVAGASERGAQKDPVHVSAPGECRVTRAQYRLTGDATVESRLQLRASIVRNLPLALR